MTIYMNIYKYKKTNKYREYIFFNTESVGVVTLPWGVNNLQIFSKSDSSTKAGGGQLMPSLESLLSTSNMMTS